MNLIWVPDTVQGQKVSLETDRVATANTFINY